VTSTPTAPSPPTTSPSGDLNADGSIDSRDYLLIDAAYALTGSPLSPELLAARESQFGDAYVAALIASVPEPSLAFLFPTLIFRRRRI
jgi:hypothetical protein